MIHLALEFANAWGSDDLCPKHSVELSSQFFRADFSFNSVHVIDDPLAGFRVRLLQSSVTSTSLVTYRAQNESEKMLKLCSGVQLQLQLTD